MTAWTVPRAERFALFVLENSNMTTTMIERPQPMYSIKEVCNLLRIDDDTLLELRRAGLIRSVYIGSVVRFSALEVERVCAEGAGSKRLPRNNTKPVAAVADTTG